MWRRGPSCRERRFSRVLECSPPIFILLPLLSFVTHFDSHPHYLSLFSPPPLFPYQPPLGAFLTLQWQKPLWVCVCCIYSLSQVFPALVLSLPSSHSLVTPSGRSFRHRAVPHAFLLVALWCLSWLHENTVTNGHSLCAGGATTQRCVCGRVGGFLWKIVDFWCSVASCFIIKLIFESCSFIIFTLLGNWQQNLWDVCKLFR